MVDRSLLLLAASVCLVSALFISAQAASDPLPYRSPQDVAYSPDGRLVAVSDHTAGTVCFVDAEKGALTRTVKLQGKPAGVTWSPDGKSVFVSEQQASSIAEVDAKSGKITRRIAAGYMPEGLAVSAKHNVLLSANSAVHTVSIIDLATGKTRAEVAVKRAPFAIALTPDETTAVVSNMLPADASTDYVVSSVLTIIDLKSMKTAGEVRLPSGSILTRNVAVSPDGRWAYTVHAVGRFTVPTTQLERGWINTNALSVIDLKAKKQYATMLLDQPSQGAAEPWGIALSSDGKTMWITLSGVHKIAVIAMGELHKLLEGNLESHPELAEMGSGYSGSQSIWKKIKEDPKERRYLVNDLSALYIAGVIQKPRLEGKGPRGIAVSPDGKQLAAALHYSGSVALLDSGTCRLTTAVSLGKSPALDIVRRGEMIFHDADYCFQKWMSCSTCHPFEARADGLNWDLLNDGIGNPKNTKSLLLSHATPPSMSRGVRSSMEVAALAGFHHILFREPEKKDVEAVQAYIRSRKPVRSPYRLPSGELTKKAQKGKAIFESQKTQCSTCHTGKYFTNKQIIDVGTRGKYDRVDAFDTPTLIELWRTSPYLHDGSAPTLMGVITTHNKKDRHGVTSHLSKEEREALVEYLLSL